MTTPEEQPIQSRRSIVQQTVRGGFRLERVVRAPEVTGLFEKVSAITEGYVGIVLPEASVTKSQKAKAVVPIVGYQEMRRNIRSLGQLTRKDVLAELSQAAPSITEPIQTRAEFIAASPSATTGGAYVLEVFFGRPAEEQMWDERDTSRRVLANLGEQSIDDMYWRDPGSVFVVAEILPGVNKIGRGDQENEPRARAAGLAAGRLVRRLQPMMGFDVALDPAFIPKA